ncbi:MAG: hypothetical protein ACOZNI_11895 [Myxococcota bacterium]
METAEERRERERKEREEHRRRMRRRPYGGHAVGALFVGLTLAGIAASMYSAVTTVKLKAKRSELPSTLDRVKGALATYEEHAGRWPSLGDPGEAYAALERGEPYAPFAELGWSPAGVRGAYWVIGGDDGYEVHGILDADGDGIPAHWVATPGAKAHPITGDGVY